MVSGLLIYTSFLQENEAVNINMGSLYPAFDHLQAHAIRHQMPQLQQVVKLEHAFLYMHVIVIIHLTWCSFELWLVLLIKQCSGVHDYILGYKENWCKLLCNSLGHKMYYVFFGWLYGFQDFKFLIWFGPWISHVLVCLLFSWH